MAFEDMDWVAFADKQEGRLTVLKSDMGLYPGEVALDPTLSDGELQVWRAGVDIVALVANLAPETSDAGPDFAMAATELLRTRVGLDITRTMLGTAFHVLPGAFAWRISHTAANDWS